MTRIRIKPSVGQPTTRLGTSVVSGKGASVAGTTITVSAPDAWLANLPTGPTELVDVDFTLSADLNDPNTKGSDAGVTDATAPYSPDKVARFVYPAGNGQGFSTGQRRDTCPADTVRVYISFNLRMSDNYTVHPIVQKIAYLFRDTSQSQGSWIFGVRPASGETNYTSGALRWYMGTQANPDVTYYANENVVAPVRNQWYHIEILSVMSSAESATDGVFQVWIDGVRQFNYSTVSFSGSGQALVWRNAALNMYYGGNSPGHTIDETCYIYVDHWTVYSDTARS